MSGEVFIPLYAIRCGPGGTNRTLVGHIGYYGGKKVIRYRCSSECCKWRDDPDGNRVRVVTFHHDDIETGERVKPDERRPYQPPESRR